MELLSHVHHAVLSPRITQRVCRVTQPPSPNLSPSVDEKHWGTAILGLLASRDDRDRIQTGRNSTVVIKRGEKPPRITYQGVRHER